MIGAANGRRQRVGRVVRAGLLGEAKQNAHHLLDLIFLRAGRAGDRLFESVRRVLRKSDSRACESQTDHAFRFRDGKSGADIAGEVEGLHAGRVRLPCFYLVGDRTENFEEASIQGRFRIRFDAAVREMADPPIFQFDDAVADRRQPRIDAKNAKGRTARRPGPSFP